MKNNNPAFTLTGRTKIFLFICLGAIAIIDFSAFVYLAATGASAAFWIFPLLFFIADAIFIVQAVFSNFRFKYTVGEITFYILMTVAVLVLTVVSNFSGTASAFTTAAGTGWCLVHVLSIVAALICYLFTAKRFRSKAILQGAIAILASALCVMTAFVYVVLLADFGFFGQGTGIRPLVYEENGDGYTVTGVLDGNEENVVVPESFNGKPVTGVSATVFSATGVKSVTLECSAEVEFTEVGYYRMTEGLKIYAGKDDIDKFRKVFYEMDSRSNYDLANSLTPCALADDEVYITFNYDLSSYSIVDGEVLPTYIGKKGEKLSFDYFKGVSYAEHSDKSSDEDLYWNFNNNRNRIISSIYAGESQNLVGKEITESVDGATVSYEKIYRIYPVEGNDSKYDINGDFGFSVVNGNKLEYKLTVAENADAIISGISRAGFEIEWLQRKNSYSNFTEMTSLKAELEKFTSETDLYVYPKWSLNAPTVSLTSDKSSVVYGGDITLSATVTPPVEGMEVIYNWRESEDGYTLCWDKDYKIENIEYGKTGYVLVATVRGDNTSLLSDSVANIPVTVTKKPLTVNWTVPENLVYNGENKSVTCAISGGIINDDVVSLSKTQFYLKNAGSYNEEVELIGANSEKYYISAGQSQSVTIEKANLTVNWLESETVYNGEAQSPQFTVSGVYNDEVKYSVTSRSEAGDWTVRFTATEGGENYKIINETANYRIKPYPLSVEWHADCEDTFTYDGKTHAVTATASGVKDTTVELTVTNGTLKNAGTYEVKASTADKNYEIVSNATKTYTVSKYGLTVEWGETKLTYTGTTQGPDYVMRGVGSDGSVLGGVRGSKKDVGDNYVCEMSTITDQHDWGKNYYIANNAQTTFSIVPAEVEVKWNPASYYYYNGKEQAPTAWIVGLGDDSSVPLRCTVVGAVNAGMHTAKATLDHELSKNYKLIGDTHAFTIGVVGVSVTAQPYEMTYGDSVPEKFMYTVSQLAGNDTLAEVIAGVTTSVKDPVYVNGYLKPGTYEITVEVANGEKASNYSIICGSATLTVNKKAITVTIADAEMTLGDELPEFTYTVTGLVGEDEVIKSYKLFEGEITGAGVYNIMIDEYGEGITDLYIVSAVHGKLTVSQAEVEDEV